jgi:hypothetical protein
MRPEEAAALAAIYAVYGAQILYTGADIVDEPVVAIRSDRAPVAFQGFDGQAGRLWFEIPKSDLPERPRKRDVIVEASGDRWSAIDIDETAPDVAAWVVFVETAEPI